MQALVEVVVLVVEIVVAVVVVVVKGISLTHPALRPQLPRLGHEMGGRAKEGERQR